MPNIENPESGRDFFCLKTCENAKTECRMDTAEREYREALIEAMTEARLHLRLARMTLLDPIFWKMEASISAIEDWIKIACADMACTGEE